MNIQPVGVNQNRQQNFGKLIFASPEARSALIRALKETRPEFREYFRKAIAACNEKGDSVIMHDEYTVEDGYSWYRGCNTLGKLHEKLCDSVGGYKVVPETTKSLAKSIKESTLIING